MAFTVKTPRICRLVSPARAGDRRVVLGAGDRRAVPGAGDRRAVLSDGHPAAPAHGSAPLRPSSALWPVAPPVAPSSQPPWQPWTPCRGPGGPSAFLTYAPGVSIGPNPTFSISGRRTCSGSAAAARVPSSRAAGQTRTGSVPAALHLPHPWYLPPH